VTTTPTPADQAWATLTPTEDLILTLLASQRRLGRTMVDMETRHMKALRGLADKGFISLWNRATEKTIQTTLTERGLVLGLSPWMTAHLEPETCQSFYIGPKSSEHRFDCDKKPGHKGKQHRYTAYGTLNKPLRWTDDEAGGRVSARYGPDIRRHEAERREAIAAAIDELRPGASIEDFERF
jgi:hypothetical protein